MTSLSSIKFTALAFALRKGFPSSLCSKIITSITSKPLDMIRSTPEQINARIYMRLPEAVLSLLPVPNVLKLVHPTTGTTVYLLGASGKSWQSQCKEIINKAKPAIMILEDIEEPVMQPRAHRVKRTRKNDSFSTNNTLFSAEDSAKVENLIAKLTKRNSIKVGVINTLKAAQTSFAFVSCRSSALPNDTLLSHALKRTAVVPSQFLFFDTALNAMIHGTSNLKLFMSLQKACEKVGKETVVCVCHPSRLSTLHTFFLEYSNQKRIPSAVDFSFLEQELKPSAAEIAAVKADLEEEEEQKKAAASASDSDSAEKPTEKNPWLRFLAWFEEKKKSLAREFLNTDLKKSPLLKLLKLLAWFEKKKSLSGEKVAAIVPQKEEKEVLNIDLKKKDRPAFYDATHFSKSKGKSWNWRRARGRNAAFRAAQLHYVASLADRTSVSSIFTRVHHGRVVVKNKHLLKLFMKKFIAVQKKMTSGSKNYNRSHIAAASKNLLLVFVNSVRMSLGKEPIPYHPSIANSYKWKSI